MVEDYAETAGKRRKGNDTVDGTQRGDPAKAAEANLAIVHSPNAPSLAVLGQDTRDAFAAVAGAPLTEPEELKDLSMSTGTED